MDLINKILTPNYQKYFFAFFNTLLWSLFLSQIFVPNSLVCRDGPFGCEKGPQIDCSGWQNFTEFSPFKHPCSCDCMSFFQVAWQNMFVYIIPFVLGCYLFEKYADKNNKLPQPLQSLPVIFLIALLAMQSLLNYIFTQEIDLLINMIEGLRVFLLID